MSSGISPIDAIFSKSALRTFCVFRDMSKVEVVRSRSQLAQTLNMHSGPNRQLSALIFSAIRDHPANSNPESTTSYGQSRTSFSSMQVSILTKTTRRLE
jgi:hypothetical protein